MIEINIAKTAEVFTYFYNADNDMFGSTLPGLRHGFTPTHKVVLDNTLYAQEIDVVLGFLFEGKS